MAELLSRMARRATRRQPHDWKVVPGGWRLCRVKKVLPLPEFTVLVGLYEEVELNHRLFAIHFTRLEVDDKLFNHEAFWQKIGQPTSTNPRTSLIKEPLMSIVHKLLVGSLVHRADSKESPSFGGDHYGAHGDGYHVGSIVPSLGNEIGRSSTGFHGYDFDPIVHSEDYVEGDDDEMRD
nr:hypothetical protein [Tanacetum cinerariifolium]